MIWFLVLGLLLLGLPWLFLKQLKVRHKRRDRLLRENADRHARDQSLARTLRSAPLPPQPTSPPSTLGEGEQRRSPETKAIPKQRPQPKTVRRLPPPEYHWLKKNHRQNIQAATQTLMQLREQTRSLESDQALKIVIGSLRRIDPFMFEELLLHCFQEQGWRVARNERYTGDDGIDGRIYRDEKLFFVQAKRYSGHIDAAHLREFEAVIQQYGAAGGYFIHTGRTGETARRVVRLKGSKVILLSGMKVVDFVLGRERRTL
jgi:restriction system protein